MDDETTSTPAALLQCLRMLSEEAASLHLTGTYAVLQDAMATCRAEADATPFGMHGAAGQLLH